MASMLVLAALLLAPATQVQGTTPPQRAEARQAYRRGEELMRHESFEEAASAFGLAARLDPMYAMAFYSLGQARMALKQYPEAVEAYLGCKGVFERLSTLDSQERSALERQREDELRELKDSLQRVRAGKIKGASIGLDVGIEERIRLLESTRQRGDEKTGGVPAELFLALGSARFRAGRLPEAEADYVSALQANPGLGAAHNNLAVIYMLSGRFDLAREAVRKAEKAGVRISPQLKDDIERRAKAAAAAN